MTGEDRRATRCVERPSDPRALVPYLGRRITALPDGGSPWTGQLIAVGDHAHIGGPDGEIREFRLSDTVFAVPHEDGA